MLRSALIGAVVIFAALSATCAGAQENAQQNAQQLTRPPVGGVASPKDAMIFYAAHGGEEACGVNCSDWIAAEGAVQWDTFKRLFAFLDRFGQRKMLVLDIKGAGDLKTAMSLGKIIRDRKLDVSAGTTVVNGCARVSEADCFALKRGGTPVDARLDTSSVTCDLACVLILAGGVHRTLPADAKVVIGGVDIRNRATPNVSQEVREGLHTYYDEQLALYLTQMGINPQIVTIIDRDTKTKRATSLSNNDWLKLGLVTGLAL
jgi:hypothetical protein